MRGDTGRRDARSGFTLIELMIVVAIIGLLSAIAVPKFSDLLMKTREGNTKGNLGRIRSALNIYYSDMEGYFPSSGWNWNSNSWTGLTTSLVPKYINVIPKAQLRWHAESNRVYMHSYSQGHSHDSSYGHWGYDGYTPATGDWGRIYIWCTHTDKNGQQWSTY